MVKPIHNNRSMDSLRILGWPAFRNKERNPYNWLLYRNLQRLDVYVDEYSRRRAVLGHYDILHIHWPEGPLNDEHQLQSFAILVYEFFMFDLMRQKDTKLLWTVHNLGSHESNHRRLESWYWRNFVPKLDGTISMSRFGQQELFRRFPLTMKKPSFIVPLGNFRAVYPDVISKEECRQRLNIGEDTAVATFLGQIRPYKNVPYLIQAFTEIADPDRALIVAGKPISSAMGSEIHGARRNDERVRLFLEFISWEEIQVYLKAADLVILPFTDILNSASALLALSFSRPILVPARGTMLELEEEYGPNWVRTYNGELSSKVLVEGFEWAISLKSAVPLDMHERDFNAVAGLTKRAYRELASHNQSRSEY